MAATDTKVGGRGYGPHHGVGNDVPRHTFRDTYTDEGDDGIFLGSRADEPAVLQLVGDGSRVGAAFRSIDAGTSDGRPTLGRRGWGAHKAAARRGGAPPVSTTIQAGIWPAQQSSGRRLRTLGLLHRQPVAPTEVVFEAASSLLFGMDNLNNGDPQFDPRASTTPAAQGTGRRGRSQRRHGERPATSQDPPPPEPTVDVPPTFRRPLVAAPVPRRGPRRLQVQEPGGGGGATDQEQLPAGTADDQSARDRDSAVRPSAGARRRSVTAAPFRNRLSNEQIAAIEREMTDEYRQHKRAMHKAGARASSYDNPGAVRHLRKQSLADVVDLENRVPGPARSRRRRRSARIGIRGSCRRLSSGCASPG